MEIIIFLILGVLGLIFICLSMLGFSEVVATNGTIIMFGVILIVIGVIWFIFKFVLDW